MSALAASSAEVNPDLLAAQRVLAELVRGSEESGRLVFWAVSVLRLPFGTQIFVASNMGGGWYLPSTVFLPTVARLAVNDPSLPMGWAEDWMGCQKPSKILVDHFDRLRKYVAGVTLSALVTTDGAGPPVDVGGDFLCMEHRDAMRLLSEAPRFDAGHQHRLATVNVGLMQRIQGLDRGGDVSDRAAAVLTGALFRAATQSADGSASVVTTADGDMLEAVHAGTANRDMWVAYDHAARDRDGGRAVWPEQFQGVQDNDGSDAARNAIRLYYNYFRIARMIELVQCWKSRPPQLADVAYCGVMAGFGAVVLSAITELEQRMGGKAL
jgi:hypothetical protein